MKCGKCGSENLEKKDDNWVCKDCWQVQQKKGKGAYTYPLSDPLKKR